MSIIRNVGKEIDGLKFICARFPDAFFMYQLRRKPLKIGILNDIEVVLGDAVDRKLLRRVLKIYFVNIGYFRSLQAGAARIDLDGRPVGIVTEEEAQRAVRATAGLRAAIMAAEKKKRIKNQEKKCPAPNPEPKPEPRRDGLASLREAAAARRQRTATGGGT